MSSPSLESDWDAAFVSEQVLSQQESEEMESACGMRSESGSESESDRPRKKLPCWWARVIVKATEALGFDWPELPKKPVQIVSGCTGVSAEAAVLKERGLQMNCWFTLF